MRQFPGGEGFFKISRDGGRDPRWRDDGRELFFLTLDGMLMAAGIETAKGLQPTVPQPLFHTGSWPCKISGTPLRKTASGF